MLKLCLVAFFATTLAAACGEDQKQNEADTGTDCPGGMIEGPDGDCIRNGGGEDTGTDDSGPIDATDTDESDDEDTTQTDEDTSQTDDDTSQQSECDEECADDEFCLEGSCRKGQECEPGEIIGCADQNSLRVCPDKGIGWEEQQCPVDEPNCLNSECTANECEPGQNFCGDKFTLMECADDGESSTELKDCRKERGRCRAGECVSGCGGNSKSYIGCGFHAVDLSNFTIECSGSGGSFDSCSLNNQGQCQNGVCSDGNANKQQFAVTVSNTTDNDLTVDVEDSDGQSVTSENVSAGDLQVIDLPQNDVMGSALTDNVYHVNADGPITVHQFNPKNQGGVFTNDASLLLPSNALGKEYTVVGWPSMRDSSQSSDLQPNNRAYVSIVAVQDQTTTVDVDTPAAIVGGNGVSSMSAGSTEQFQLDGGEVLHLMAEQNEGEDLTGMTIEADNNIAVFSGHECTNIPLDTPFCDHIEQQLYPTDTWGKEYVLSKFAERGTEDDIYRIVAAEDGTTLSTTPTLNNLDGTTLDAGEMKEIEFRGDVVLEADKPIAVAQFMVGSAYPGPDEGCDPSPFGGDTSGCKVQKKCQDANKDTRIGDPAFLMNVPQTQFRDNYVVQTPSGYQEDWLTIIAEKDADVTVDGNALSSSGDQIGSTDWRIHREKVSPGVHRVESKKPVGLYAYGYECDVSYAYPGGLDLQTSRQP